MHLYLVQHGEPVAKDVDPARPLSERGRQEVTRVAQFGAGNGRMELARIHHSGKLRAAQTAAIFAASLNLPEPLPAEGLAPLDDPAPWAARLKEEPDSLMLVGHLPHLAKLAGVLLCGAAEAAPVGFRMGGIAALAREEGAWSLRWMVVPDILAG